MNDQALPVNVDMLFANTDPMKPVAVALADATHAISAGQEVTDEELENAKTLLEADDLYGREKLTDYSHTLAFWWSTTGIDYFRGYYKNLRATTRDDINKYLHTYIQGKPHVGVALLSEESQKIAQLTPADLTGGQQ